MSKVKKVMDKYNKLQYLLEIEGASDVNYDINKQTVTLLESNGWMARKASQESPTIDTVYINKNESAWVWYDKKIKTWLYSDNPTNRTVNKINNEDVLKVVKTLS